jgi:hypothetical protein
MFGIPVLGPPEWNDILVAEAGGVAVVLEVVFVLWMPFDVHVAGIPIALLGN